MIFAARRIDLALEERLYFYAGVAVTLFLLGMLIWAILKIREWFLESNDSEATLPEMIGQFRDLARQGELTEEEYRLISHRLTENVGSSSPLLITGKGIGGTRKQEDKSTEQNITETTETKDE